MPESERTLMLFALHVLAIGRKRDERRDETHSVPQSAADATTAGERETSTVFRAGEEVGGCNRAGKVVVGLRTAVPVRPKCVHVLCEVSLRRHPSLIANRFDRLPGWPFPFAFCVVVLLLLCVEILLDAWTDGRMDAWTWTIRHTPTQTHNECGNARPHRHRRTHGG